MTPNSLVPLSATPCLARNDILPTPGQDPGRWNKAILQQTTTRIFGDTGVVMGSISFGKPIPTSASRSFIKRGEWLEDDRRAPGSYCSELIGPAYPRVTGNRNDRTRVSFKPGDRLRALSHENRHPCALSFREDRRVQTGDSNRGFAAQPSCRPEIAEPSRHTLSSSGSKI